MDARKFSQIQNQMVQNQTEVSNFMADLDTWKNEISQKDEVLKKGGSVEEKDLPPVRNSLKKKRRVRIVEKSAPKKKQTPKRIPGSDFAAWDKYDADKEAERVDQGGEQAVAESSSDGGETDEEWEIERRKLQGTSHKETGNAQFKQGNYEDALKSYSRGTDVDPGSFLLWANRAMALLKLGRLEEAEADSTRALAIDPMYVKAYQRRGFARLRLKKLHEAKEDFERILKLDPGNTMATKELDTVDKKLNIKVEPAGIVHAVKKSPSERSKKPLVEIPIEEVGDLVASSLPNGTSLSQLPRNSAQSKAKEQEEARFESLLSSAGSAKKISGKPSNQASPSEEKPKKKKSVKIKIQEVSSGEVADMKELGEQTSKVSIEEVHPADLSEPPASVKGVDEGSGEKKPVSTTENRTTLPLKADEPKKKGRSRRKKKSAASSGGEKKEPGKTEVTSSEPKSVEGQKSSPRVTESPAPIISPRGSESPLISPRSRILPPAPQTSYQFQTAWQTVREDDELAYKYIKSMEPTKLPVLFGQSLEADIFYRFMVVFRDQFIKNGDDVFPYLTNFVEVKRFSMCVMFLSDKEKKVVTEVLGSIEKTGTHSKERMSSLRKSYS